MAIKSADYITAMLSTEAPVGSVIKHSDGGRAGIAVRPGALGLLCGLSEDPALPALLAGINQHDVEPNYAPENELNIIWGPETLPSPAASPPTFRNLTTTGLLCSTRQTVAGERIRIQFIGGPAAAGHAHDDRGSFVLEAFGEELAVDRGQMAYVDPRSALMKLARYHNLAIPHSDGHPLRQHNPCPVASTASGSGDLRNLDCRMDLTGVWPAPIGVCSRELRSLESPEVLEVIDNLTADQPITVGFYLHSRSPWQRGADGWVTQGQRARLTVLPAWQPVQEEAEEDFVLGTKEPAYRLRLLTPAASSHQLTTTLTVSEGPS